MPSTLQRKITSLKLAAVKHEPATPNSKPSRMRDVIKSTLNGTAQPKKARHVAPNMVKPQVYANRHFKSASSVLKFFTLTGCLSRVIKNYLKTINALKRL